MRIDLLHIGGVFKQQIALQIDKTEGLWNSVV